MRFNMLELILFCDVVNKKGEVIKKRIEYVTRYCKSFEELERFIDRNNLELGESCGKYGRYKAILCDMYVVG